MSFNTEMIIDQLRIKRKSSPSRIVESNGHSIKRHNDLGDNIDNVRVNGNKYFTESILSACSRQKNMTGIYFCTIKNKRV